MIHHSYVSRALAGAATIAAEYLYVDGVARLAAIPDIGAPRKVLIIASGFVLDLVLILTIWSVEG